MEAQAEDECPGDLALLVASGWPCVLEKACLLPESSPDGHMGRAQSGFCHMRRDGSGAEVDGMAPAWTQPFSFVDLGNHQALVSMLVS